MRTTIRSTHDLNVEDIANQYLNNGYKIDQEVPKFLANYHPDLIATKDSDKVVIEVKSDSKVRGPSYWGELASVVEKQPGWRFELILDRGPGKPAYNFSDKSLDITEIDHLLAQSEKLETEGFLEGAVLIAWSAFEAAARAALISNEVNLKDKQSNSLISALYSNLLIEREDFDLLLEIYPIRNSLAHGFKSADISQIQIKKLRSLINNLTHEITSQ